MTGQVSGSERKGWVAGWLFVKSICMHAWSGDGGLKVVASFWMEGGPFQHRRSRGTEHTV